MYFWLLTRVELSGNQIVQTVLLNYLIIRKFNPCVVELSEVELFEDIQYVNMSICQYVSMSICQNPTYQLRYQNESCSECHHDVR